MDLSIGEFQEVGDTVKECASDDATVVVGTVIDPDMGNNIRVTVVATGLGQPLTRQQQPPSVRVVAPAPAAEPPNWSDLDRPTTQRNRAVAAGDERVPAEPPEFDLLDIPAFLRRQAD